MQIEVAPLKEHEDRSGDDTRHEGAAPQDFRIGYDGIDQGEAAPDDDQGREFRKKDAEERIPCVEEPEQITSHRAGHEPEDRGDHRDDDVVEVLAGDIARGLNLPDVVESALHRPEDPDDGPEKGYDADQGDKPALRIGEGFAGEFHHVVQHFDVLREKGVEIVDQAVQKPESLDYGEYQRQDRDDRDERIERQGGAAHDRIVGDQPACRVEQQLVLSDGPPDAGIAVGVLVAPQDRVREVGEDVLDFHFGTFLKGSYFRRIVQ